MLEGVVPWGGSSRSVATTISIGCYKQVSNDLEARGLIEECWNDISNTFLQAHKERVSCLQGHRGVP